MTERDVYTHGHSDAVLRSHRQRTAANSAAYLVPSLSAGMRLLDVGCGPGTLTVDLARLVAPGEVVGVDVSADVVDEAGAFAAGTAVGAVRFIAGDFRSVGLESHSFDVVHAHQVLQHLRDPIGALRAMRDLAKPGGVVAARDSVYSSFAWYPEEPRLDRWLEIYLAVTAANGADADAGTRLLSWAKEAGFTDAAASSSTWTWATPDERAWWCELWAERTVGPGLGGQAVEYGIATADELADIADGWRQWAGHDDGVFVVVHGEILARA
ncbi:MAG TPA: class I SAM-dependent methyltransferase [Acidimicrobiales bacterium]|nr:class I SAM-dependent methyltransferase [Acidimicrobiales bacterium]